MWLCHMDILAIFAILHNLRIWRTLFLHGQYYANMCGSKSQKSTRFYHGYLPGANFASIEVQVSTLLANIYFSNNKLSGKVKAM